MAHNQKKVNVKKSTFHAYIRKLKDM